MADHSVCWCCVSSSAIISDSLGFTAVFPEWARWTGWAWWLWATILFFFPYASVCFWGCGMSFEVCWSCAMALNPAGRRGKDYLHYGRWRKSSAMSDNKRESGRKELECCGIVGLFFELMDGKEMCDLKTQPDPNAVCFSFCLFLFFMSLFIVSHSCFWCQMRPVMTNPKGNDKVEMH